MTRDSNTISAVFMAVVLVLASGAAVSFAATADAGPNAVGAQETTTEDGVDETTTADDDQDGEQASVTFDDQESDGERLVIDSVTLPEGGFVAIHSENWEDAPLSTVLGNSAYLEAGTHEDVEISLARPLDETQTVTAMLHSDTNDNRVLDFVLSSGALDGPVTADGSPVVDDANVTVEAETTTEEVTNETTTEEDEGIETTTEEGEVTETTTEEDVADETTTEEDEVPETTTEADDVETETTTEADVETETPADGMQQLVFKIEEMAIDRWSFVVGDEETTDETVYVNGSDLLPPDGSLTDERVTVDLAQLAEQGEVSQDDLMYTTTQSPEEIEQDLQENLSGDIPTVRYVIQNVNVENVTLVVMVPEDMELPDQPTVEEPTTTEEDEVTETTTEEDELTETTTEEDVVETTTEEDVDETTTTEEEVMETTTEEEEVDETTTTEEDEVTETTTEEEDVEPVTTTEDGVDETTTTEEDVEPVTTTEEDEVTETTTEAEEPADEVASFEVSELDAPESATVGDTIDVSATVTNPNDEEATQTVAFRLEGDVIAREDVTLAGGESSTVSFGVDTSAVPPGEYVHGVYTMNFGDLDVIVLEEAADEGDETDDEGDAETTVGDEMATTTAVAN
jgi:hypothetical protein